MHLTLALSSAHVKFDVWTGPFVVRLCSSLFLFYMKIFLYAKLTEILLFTLLSETASPPSLLNGSPPGSMASYNSGIWHYELLNIKRITIYDLHVKRDSFLTSSTCSELSGWNKSRGVEMARKNIGNSVHSALLIPTALYQMKPSVCLECRDWITLLKTLYTPQRSLWLGCDLLNDAYNLGQNKWKTLTSPPPPPPPPKWKIRKWLVFALRAASSLIWGAGGWGFAAPFYLSKIVGRVAWWHKRRGCVGHYWNDS